LEGKEEAMNESTIGTITDAHELRGHVVAGRDFLKMMRGQIAKWPDDKTMEVTKAQFLEMYDNMIRGMDGNVILVDAIIECLKVIDEMEGKP
jgi:hypothetical protein